MNRLFMIILVLFLVIFTGCVSTNVVVDDTPPSFRNGVKAFMDKCIAMARENGYVETMYGRRRFLPDILSRNSVVRGNAERNAINSPIQGSAADIIKIAMVNIHEAMEKERLNSSMILQVHDELNFDVLPGEIEQLRRIVKDQMENVASLKVPLTIDMGEGANWLEAH